MSNEVYKKHLLRKKPQGGVIMRVTPINLNNSYYTADAPCKLISFRNKSLKESDNSTQNQDTTQFKSIDPTAAKSSTSSFIGRMYKSLNNIVKPVKLTSNDPRNSESPWIRAFLF